MNNLLLNPGPTNTLSEVKESQSQHSDVCHRTEDFMFILNETKNLLLSRFSEKATLKDWNVSIFGGSGTAAMEALISSLLDNTNIIISGKYGLRAKEMMDFYSIESISSMAQDSSDLAKLKLSMISNKLYFVENETTTGEKFCLEDICHYFPKKRLFIDATSAFGATDYTEYLDNIDAISFCSNKCLQSTPGLGIVIWKKSLIVRQKNYYLNLKKYSSNDIPFTLPVQCVAALRTALKKSAVTEELMNKRRDKVIYDFAKLNIRCVNHKPCNSIMGFIHPNKSYQELRQFLESKKIIIYDGIKNIKNSFRVSTMSVRFDEEYDYILRSFRDSCIH